MPRCWYVVCDENCSYEEGPERDSARVWTINNDPKNPGWNTDSGFPGYGLKRADAEFLVKAANAYEEYVEMELSNGTGNHTTTG